MSIDTTFRRLVRGVGTTALLVLAGCSAMPERTPVPGPAPASVPPGPTVPAPAVAAPATAPSVQVAPAGKPAPIVAPAPVVAAPYAGAAVAALLAQARNEAASGDAERAAATLERALRIEPTNPWLWHRLAVLRLQQGHWAQAQTLAARSNSFAAGNLRLLGGNWQVIGEARRGAGDTARAAEALRQSEEFFRSAAPP